MEDAALFLMGSYYEGLPNSLLEAGMLGIPVIAFDAPGGIHEIIIQGENGLLVTGDDENAYAAAIQNAVQMNFDRNAIIEMTKKRFGVNHIIPQIEDLFVQFMKTGV